MPQDIGILIKSTPGIVGGRPRIDGTRIAVRTIAGWYKQGYNAEEIAEQYEHISLAQVYAALTYYHANQGEIEADLAAEEALYNTLMQEHYLEKKSA